MYVGAEFVTGRTAVSAGRRSLRRHGRPVPAQADARPVPPRQRRVHSRAAAIIGVSLDDIDADGFRTIAREALERFSSRKMIEADWAAFAQTLDYVPLAAGAGALKAAVERAEQSLGAESRRVHYLSVPPTAALPAVRLLAEAGLVDQCRIIMEKPFGTDLASAVVAQRPAARGLRRGPDLPDRPLPRQGGGAEHPGLPLRQRPVRADLEPELHRPRADRRARDAGPRPARRVLRGDRRVPRHGGDAPVPDPRLHGDGAADRARAGADQRGEEQGLPQHAADRARRTSSAGSMSATVRGAGSIPNRTRRPSSR